MIEIKFAAATPEELRQQVGDFLAALNGKPAQVRIARPEGEFPEWEDDKLADVLRMVLDSGELSVDAIKSAFHVSYLRAAHLRNVVEQGCKWDPFLAGMWLDDLERRAK